MLALGLLSTCLADEPADHGRFQDWHAERFVADSREHASRSKACAPRARAIAPCALDRWRVTGDGLLQRSPHAFAQLFELAAERLRRAAPHLLQSLAELRQPGFDVVPQTG